MRSCARIAYTGAWGLSSSSVVITFDVVTRKAGIQLPGLGSTRLQELEWHLHALLFCAWLGYAYVRNAHVRIDVFTAHLCAGAARGWN
jgi:TRAP-type mannitol/chloroaromatic compound transport system permease small subunit